MELNPQLPAADAPAPRAFGDGIGPGPRVVADRPVDLARWAGRPDPVGNEIRKWEQPWHRNAAYMVASGKYAMRQVAEACEKSYQSVKDLMKNPWFQATVSEIQKQNGAGDIMDLFRAECHSSLVTFVELRDDPKVPASVRHNCAKSILEQVLGKPTQRVETTDVPHSDDVVAEVERLEKENAMLQHRPASSSETTSVPHETA
jgi:hypothetical protein